jgi:DNA-binding XRE family transcriptional regulator
MESSLLRSPVGKFRAEFQLTRQRLAVLLKTNISTIYRWERDNTIPTLQLQARMESLRRLFSDNPRWREYSDLDLRAAVYLPKPPLVTPERTAKLARLSALTERIAAARSGGRVVPPELVREVESLQAELGIVAAVPTGEYSWESR